MVGVAGFEPATPASRTLLLHRISLKSLTFWLYSHPNNPDRSRRSRGYTGVGCGDWIDLTQDFSVGCEDVQPSQIASNRCGASTLESITHIRHYRKLVIRANDLTEPAPLDGVA
jgi:hypothetical protein